MTSPPSEKWSGIEGRAILSGEHLAIKIASWLHARTPRPRGAGPAAVARRGATGLDMSKLLKISVVFFKTRG